MKTKLIKLVDFIVNNLPAVGFMLVLAAMVYPPLLINLAPAAAGIHFLNEVFKNIKAKNKWDDIISFMEYVTGMNLRD
jgi:predicted RND superfamily exporter protein